MTRELYDNEEIVEQLQTNYPLNDSDKSILARLSEASDNLNPTMLEIMATYAFLVFKSRDSKQSLITLKQLKPFYSEAQIAVGVSRAKQLFFAPTEKEIKEMKAEFNEWDKASNTSI